MNELVIADVSEFQGVVHPSPNSVIIIRAHNGWRPDVDFNTNRANAHAAGCPAIGIYQYLAASRDAAVQASDLLSTIGRLAPNEFLICDLEEGAGDEQPRWTAWWTTIMAATKRAPWLYSGLSFAAAHGLHPDWVAAYQAVEPGVPHKLWQNTDVYPWPWGKADGSVFDGTLPQFLDSVGITLPAPIVPAPTSDPSEEEDMPKRVYAVLTTGGSWFVVNFDDGWKIPVSTPSDGSAFTDALPQGAGLPVIKDKFSDAELADIPTKTAA